MEATMLTCMPFARCRGGQLAQQQEEEEEARKREERRQQKKQAEEAEQKAREEEPRAARMAKQVREPPLRAQRLWAVGVRVCCCPAWPTDAEWN